MGYTYDDLPEPGMFIPHVPGKGPQAGGRRRKRKTKKLTKTKTKKRIKRKIYTGPRGGKYYRKGGRKVYI